MAEWLSYCATGSTCIIAGTSHISWPDIKPFCCNFFFTFDAMKTRPLLNGVNEILPVVSTFIVRYRWYSLYWMGVESLQNHDDTDVVVSEKSVCAWTTCVSLSLSQSGSIVLVRKISTFDRTWSAWDQIRLLDTIVSQKIQFHFQHRSVTSILILYSLLSLMSRPPKLYRPFKLIK
jgi:hypothetical protein